MRDTATSRGGASWPRCIPPRISASASCLARRKFACPGHSGGLPPAAGVNTQPWGASLDLLVRHVLLASEKGSKRLDVVVLVMLVLIIRAAVVFVDVVLSIEPVAVVVLHFAPFEFT